MSLFLSSSKEEKKLVLVLAFFAFFSRFCFSCPRAAEVELEHELEADVVLLRIKKLVQSLLPLRLALFLK